MRPMKRAIHIDFHTMPGIYDFGRAFDAREFAKILDDAQVKYINAFAMCNLGFCYYPTKIGVPYPTMKGDMFGSLLEECHKRDIGVTAYLNVGLNHEHARLHADWVRVDKEGRILRGDRTANFFRTMCYNSPGYREYLIGIIHEICDYDIDGLFCDCMVHEACYCSACMQGMIENGYDPSCEADALAYSKKVMLDFGCEVKKIVGSDRYLYLNGMPYAEVQSEDTHIEIECLPSGGWGYDYFAAQAAYARNIQKLVLYMTGRFQASWGDFGGLKRKESIENDLYDALCNCYELSIGDHMHPAENLDPNVYRTVGELYTKFKEYEKWTDGTHYISDIGVLTDSTGFLDNTYKGLARMLGELRYSFDIVNETMDLSRFSLLILPDHLNMTDTLLSKIKAHLAAGKAVLSSGQSGLNPENTAFALPEWDFEFDGLDPSNSSFFQFSETDDVQLADFKWAMYDHGILMKARPNNKKLANYIKPYFNRHWDGFHGYFYTPPEKETSHSSVLLSGNVCHICFKVFEAYFTNALYAHKALVSDILKQLLPKPLLKTENIPSTARVTATGNDRHLLVHVKTTYPEVRGKMGIVEEHTAIPAGDAVSIRGKYSSALLAPSGAPLPVAFADGYTSFTLPAVTGYQMIVLLP